MLRPTFRTLALLLIALSVTSCESSDRMLKATEQAVAGRTGRDVLAIIGGKDPSQIAKRRLDEYARDPEQVLRDLRTAQRDFQALYDALSGNVRDKWGPKEVKLPEKKKYVKYTQNYRSRAIVDFDRGQITVETLDEKTPRESLSRAVAVTLLTPQDPRVVDVFSDKEIPVNAGTSPICSDWYWINRGNRCARRRRPKPSPNISWKRNSAREPSSRTAPRKRRCSSP